VNVLNDPEHQDVADKVFIVTDSDPYDNEQQRDTQWTASGAETPGFDQDVNFNTMANGDNTVDTGSPTSGIRMLGKIHHIDHANGHGYLHGINNVYDNLIFFRNARNVEEFNELEKYDLVEFEVAQNAKGDYATNVRFNSEGQIVN
jgi:cold shock CspA family protein